MRFLPAWLRLARDLPQRWEDARLTVTVDDPQQAEHAASLLASAHPLRRGNAIGLHCERRSGVGEEAVGRLLQRLDDAGITGTIAVDSASAGRSVARAALRPLAAAWVAAVATLPADWSDLMAEVALPSSDYIERAALLMSPANPTRVGKQPKLRFRVARRFGYGVSAEMFHRCLERVDVDAIPGELNILWALSDTHNVATQGPVWRVGGKAV
ncbi:MAG: hypothetical protein ACYDA3_01775 [Gaiellaceae bacterium]